MNCGGKKKNLNKKKIFRWKKKKGGGGGSSRHAAGNDTHTGQRRWVAVNTVAVGKNAEEEQREEDSLKHTTAAT